MDWNCMQGKIRERYGFASDYVKKEVEDWGRCSQRSLVVAKRPSSS